MMKDYLFIVLLVFIGKAASQVVSPCTSMNPQYLEISTDCTKFVYCAQGRPYIVQCNSGEFYNHANGSCIKATQCPQGGSPPPTIAPPPVTTTTTTPRPTITTTPNPTGPIAPCNSTAAYTIEIPTNCTRFTYCFQGRPYIVQCYAGQYYDKITQGCIQASACPQNPPATTTTTTTTTPRPTPPTTTSTTTRVTVPTTTPTTTTTTPKPPAPTPPCTSTTSQTFEIANDCTKFLNCVGGLPYVVQCNAGEYFNAKTGTCVKATQCPQGGGTVTTPTATTTTTPRPTVTTTPPTTTTRATTTSTTTRATTTTTARPNICTSLQPSTVPYPGDDTKYYYCYEGKPYLVVCPFGTKYVAGKNGCA